MEDVEIHIDRLEIATRGLCNKIKADWKALELVPLPGPSQAIFGTLTYAASVEWAPNHISLFSHRLRLWARNWKFPLLMLWVAEFHQSGRVHYHFAIRVPAGFSLPLPDKSGAWPHGMSTVRRWKSLKRSNGSKSSVSWYLSKYLSKTRSKIHHDKVTYKGLRRLGSSGLTGKAAAQRRLFRAPEWLQPFLQFSKDIKRQGAFWVDIQQGLWWLSPWRFVRLGVGALVFVKGVIQRGYIEAEGCFSGWDGGGRLYRAAVNNA